MPPPLRRRTTDARSGLFLSLGAALVGPGAVGTAMLASGCASDAPAAEAPLAVSGVETVIRQLPDGSYRIDDEQLVEGSVGRVTVVHLDETQPGGTRVEVIDTPEAFAARLPAVPPDSTGLLGAGGSWGDEGTSAAGRSEAQARSGGGFGLGNVLLMSAMYSMWRPAAYAGRSYAPPPSAFTSERARDRSAAASGGAAAARRRGTLATPERVRAVQRAPASRATAPSGGRSGAFGSSPSPGRAGG